MLKIALQVANLDLTDDELVDAMDPALNRARWVMRGDVALAILVLDGTHRMAGVSEALGLARMIRQYLPNARPDQVFDELVSIAEIAVRANVAAESVRLWSEGRRRGRVRPFPAVQQAIPTGSRTMRLWRWRDVLAWLRAEADLDPEPGITYLDDLCIADLNHELAAYSASLEEPRVVRESEPLSWTLMWEGEVPDSAPREASERRLHEDADRLPAPAMSRRPVALTGLGWERSTVGVYKLWSTSVARPMADIHAALELFETSQ